MEYIERDLEKEILRYMRTGEILAVIGTRQCGKTTMINHILDTLGKKSKKISRVTFESAKSLQLFENDIDSFIELNIKGFDILFIDEIHYSKDGGKKLKYIHDTQKIKLIISGSSAAEMSIQSIKYLVGRIIIFTLYPFSFKEYLSAREPRIVSLFRSGKYKKEIIEKLNTHAEQFILYGGYPRVVLSQTADEKKKVLEGIYNTYLLREIKEILSLSEDYKLMNLLKALSLQIGNIVNYNELSNVTGFSYADLKKYLNVLEKTYICKLIRPFFTNKRTELVKVPKVYFFDAGFRNTSIDNFSRERPDKGALYEQLVFTELVKKGKTPKFWNTKTRAEVDFILEKENSIIPIEVKSMLRNEKIQKSLQSFIEKYRPKKGFMLSLDFEGSRTFKSCSLHFLPLVKFIGAHIS